MNINFYVVGYSLIIVAFSIIMLLVAFGSFNNKVLKKSYVDTRLYIYTSMISAVFFVATTVYVYHIDVFSIFDYIILSLIFILFGLSIMLMLYLALKPLKEIEDSTRNLARGRKDLNIDFEGAIEFDNIAKNLNDVQKNFKQQERELNKKDIEYQKFVSKQFLKFFDAKSVEDIDVGSNVQTKLCTLFCDLRNSHFSSETLSLEENFEIIKNFVAVVMKIVQKHKGFVDKVAGDGVLAVFKNEDDALKSAIEIAKHLDSQNLMIGKEKIGFGLSLNSGMCIVGVIGNKKHKQFAIASDIVNLCNRLESLNKTFNTRILMTKNFLSNLKNNYKIRYVGTIEFDDLTSKIPIFESLSAYNEEKADCLSNTIDDFESGVRYFEKKDFEKAKKYFEICNSSCEDLTSQFYLSKINNEMSKLLSKK